MKWMLALLAAVIVTVPAFAQSQDPHAKEKWENGKLISAAIERAAVKAVREHKASHCPQCGAKYTVDEKYHGVKHHCRPSAKQHSIQHCIFCGEPIESEFQSCQAVKGGYCTVQCPDCGKNLRDPKNLTQGEHRCKFKTRIVPAEPKAIEK